MTTRIAVVAVAMVAIAVACSSGAATPQLPVEQVVVADAAVEQAPLPVAEQPPQTSITDALLEREPPPPASPSKTLAKALKLYELADYHSAHLVLYELLTEQLPSAENRQRAAFYLAKTASRLGFHIPAYARFARIVEQGPSNPYATAAATWLLWLVPKVWFAAGVVPPAIVDDPEVGPFIDEARYRIAVSALTRSDLAAAVQLVEAMDPASAFHAPASLQLATTLWQFNKAASALDVLGRVDATGELGARVHMVRGSAFLRQGKHDEAIAQYAIASTFESMYQDDAVFAESAARLARDGKLGTLTDTGVDWLVQITYFEYCRRGTSADAFGQFRGLSDTVAGEVTAFATRHEDPAKLYDAVREVLAGGGTMSDRAAFLVEMVIDMDTPTEMFGFASELEAEMATYLAQDDAWKSSAAAAKFHQDIALNMSLAQADSGRIAGELLEQIAHEVEELARNTEGIVVAMLEEPGDGFTMMSKACPAD